MTYPRKIKLAIGGSTAMELVIPTVSDRDTRVEAERGVNKSLRLVRSLTELGSPLVHARQWEYTLQGGRGKMGTTT